MKNILIVLLLSLTQTVLAASNKSEDIGAEFDTLGGNKTLLEKAQALEPDMTMTVVQERTVSRRNRVEIAPEFSGTYGGDTYNRTRSFGLNVNYHFTPRWSLGVKHNQAYNALTPEGRALLEESYEDFKNNPANPTAPFPEIDYPKSETFAILDFYPMYGKFNLLDQAVVHFDLYALAGYGTVQLASGSTPSYTAGAGLGFWFTKHFSTRLEMRYQNYKAKYRSGEKSLDLTIASVQMGWML